MREIALYNIDNTILSNSSMYANQEKRKGIEKGIASIFRVKSPF